MSVTAGDRYVQLRTCWYHNAIVLSVRTPPSQSDN